VRRGKNIAAGQWRLRKENTRALSREEQGADSLRLAGERGLSET